MSQPLAPQLHFSDSGNTSKSDERARCHRRAAREMQMVGDRMSNVRLKLHRASYIIDASSVCRRDAING